MSDKPTTQDAARLLYNLRQSQAVQHKPVGGAQLDPQVALLRAWQAKRLARTYLDLLTSPRYGPACRFFLSDIYAPRDFSQRDHDIERMYHFMLKFLPGRILHPLTLAIDLYLLTNELDQTLLDVMVNNLGLTDTITAQMYVEGYRICDNYAERAKQIDLIMDVGQGISQLAHLPLVSMSIRLARRPARRAGWFELQDFLERGLAAFKQMRGARKFLNTIKKRERRILDQIFAADPNPFDTYNVSRQKYE